MVTSGFTSTAVVSIEPLRNEQRPSGFRGVYRDNKDRYGNYRYLAKVKRGGVLRTLPGSSSIDPRVAALALATWYAAEFGPNWPLALAARKTRAHRVRYSRAHRGYVACVWVMGTREEVCILKRRGCGTGAGRRFWFAPTGKLEVFGSVAEARAGVRRYLVLRYGLFARVVAWRFAEGSGTV